MKNIHVLPTDKPSRYVTNYMEQNMQWQHIYITSDEVPKDGEWCIFGESGLTQYCSDYSKKMYRKIILTTDQDLINDGVQAIDDEFLEWFVNNANESGVPFDRCEVKYDKDVFPYGVETSNGYGCYKIIIPKEESKQIYYNTVGRENGVHVVKGQFNTQKEALDLANELNRKFPDLYYDWRETLIKEEPKHIPYTGKVWEPPKQETLEEAAENYTKDGTKHFMEKTNVELGFIEGAKWQQERSQKIVPFDAVDIEVFAIKPDEDGKLFAYVGYKIANGNFEFNVVPFTEPQAERMYSEEELKEICVKYHNMMCLYGNAKTQIWFEQLKKKS